MQPFDPALASPFRVEWLVESDEVTQDDLSRAVAEKAEAILRSARFIAAHQGAEPTDIEVRVWIEAANGPACVSITWEPGFHAFGFHLLDETLRERLACIVFTELPCISAEVSDEQADEVLRAALEAIREAEAEEPATIRIPIVETTAVDPGVER